MNNLRHLHLDNSYRNEQFSEDGFRLLFDMNDGIRQLQYFRITRCAHFNDDCVDALTDW